MKNAVLLLISIFFIVACSRKQPQENLENSDQSTIADYDTTAIDSFSTGATSVDVARKIAMSSQKYQDSLILVKKVMQDEAKAKTEKDKIEKLAKETLEKEEKKKKTAAKESSSNTTAEELKTN